MSKIDKLMAHAQIWISSMFLLLVFVVIGIYETGHAHFSTEQQRLFDSTVKWLEDAGMIIIMFWFQRVRSSGVSDTSQTTVTQVHENPDGSKTTITSPATNPTLTPSSTTGVPPNATATGPLPTPGAPSLR